MQGGGGDRIHHATVPSSGAPSALLLTPSQLALPFFFFFKANAHTPPWTPTCIHMHAGRRMYACTDSRFGMLKRR